MRTQESSFSAHGLITSFLDKVVTYYSGQMHTAPAEELLSFHWPIAYLGGDDFGTCKRGLTQAEPSQVQS